MPVRYVNATLHPTHGLLYLLSDADTNYPCWVPNLAHAQFFTRPEKKYGCSVIAVTLGEKRLREVGAPQELQTKNIAPWARATTDDDKLTRAAHKKHVEWIKSKAWRRPRQQRDMRLYISIDSLNGKIEATSNPLIARKLWGDQIIEGTLIRSANLD